MQITSSSFLSLFFSNKSVIGRSVVEALCSDETVPVPVLFLMYTDAVHVKE